MIESMYGIIGNTFRNRIPVIKLGIVLHCNPHGGYVYNKMDEPLKSEVLVYLDKEAREFLLLCDGFRTIDDIARILTLDKDTIFEKICSLVDFLEWQNIIEFKPKDQMDSTKLNVSGDVYGYIPMHMVVELTSKCNFKCNHCYRESEPTKGEMLPLNKIYEPITQLVHLGCGIIEVTGGEPLLHPNAIEFLEFCCDLPFQVVVLSTNAYFLDERFVNEMREYIRAQKLFISITIDSSSSNFHDKHRGIEGSWKRAVSAVEFIAKEEGMVRVVMNILPGNMDDIEETLLLAKEIGACTFAINPVISIGRGTDVDWTYVDETKLKKYRSSMEAYKSKKYSDFVFTLPPEADEEICRENCGLGHRSWTIGPSGKVRPCIMMPEGLFPLGNILYNSINEIAMNPILHSLRIFKSPGALPECNFCKYNAFCSYCTLRAICAAQECTTCDVTQNYGLKSHINIECLSKYRYRCELATPETLSFRI